MTKPKPTKTKRSAFATWFEQQAGKPPMRMDQFMKLKYDRIPSLRAKLSEAEAECDRMEQYLVAEKFSLYAWNARTLTKEDGNA